jgi:gamma-hexachlorocyclohexane dehydrochlorinase
MTVTNHQTDTLLAQFESRRQIEDLVSTYSHSFDGHDLEGFIGVWHPDAVFDIGGPFDKYAGVKEIAQAAQSVWEAMPETRHFTANYKVELDGATSASGFGNVLAHCVEKDGRFLVTACDYHDKFERRDNVWRFASRGIVIHYRRAAEAPLVD